MTNTQGTFTRGDLEKLHGALSYMKKRVFDQGDSVRITGLIERIEDLLLAEPGQGQRLRLSPPEQLVLRRQVDIYCEELTQRGASQEGKAQAAELQRLVDRMTDRPSPVRNWFRRFLGR